MTTPCKLKTFFAIFLLHAPSLAAAAPPRIVAIPLETLLETPRYDAPATVVARDTPLVTAEINAMVTEVPVIVGDLVERGDLLARLDCARYEARRDAARAARDQATAQLRFAARQLERAQDLREKKSISEELLDRRDTELAGGETDLQSRLAELRQREIDVASCEVAAPLAGVVTARHVSVGDYVTPGSPIVDLTADRGQEVSVSLRFNQVETFAESEDWIFSARGRSWPLSLRTIVPVVDSVTRMREARMTFAEETTLPGTPGRVTWSGQEAQIPADYLVRRDGRLGVFILEDDRARFVALPGAEEGRPANSTLPAGSLLIDEGRQRLRDGESVQRVESAAAAE